MHFCRFYVAFINFQTIFSEIRKIYETLAHLKKLFKTTYFGKNKNKQAIASDIILIILSKTMSFVLVVVLYQCVLQPNYVRAAALIDRFHPSDNIHLVFRTIYLTITLWCCTTTSPNNSYVLRNNNFRLSNGPCIILLECYL